MKLTERLKRRKEFYTAIAAVVIIVAIAAVIFL